MNDIYIFRQAYLFITLFNFFSKCLYCFIRFYFSVEKERRAKYGLCRPCRYELCTSIGRRWSSVLVQYRVHSMQRYGATVAQYFMMCV